MMNRRQVLTFLTLPTLVTAVGLASVRLVGAESAAADCCIPMPGCCVTAEAVATSGPAEAAPAAVTVPQASQEASTSGSAICCPGSGCCVATGS